MKLRLAIMPLAATALLNGCVTTQGSHTYIAGRCISCINNPMTVEPINYDARENNNLPEKSRDGCRKPRNKWDNTHHFRDHRWCDDITLPGASLSEQKIYDETVPVPVDLAYVRAKQHLNFTDPDDRVTSDGYLNDNTRWDGMPGKFYSIEAFYGGPARHMLWYATYRLNIKKVSSSQSHISMSYLIYSRDTEQNAFRKSLISAIRGDL